MQHFVMPDTGECFCYELDVDQDWLTAEVQRRGLVSCPLRPSQYHVWDAASEQWIEDIAARDDALVNEARARRNALVAACDWTVLPDAPLTTAQKSAWKAYRQALRDLTNQPGFPQQIDWPVEPGK